MSNLRSFAITITVLLLIGGIGGWYYSNKVRPKAEPGSEEISPSEQSKLPLEAALTASSENITVTTNTNDVPDIGKSELEVSYTNNSERDLSGVQVWLSVGQMGTFDFPPASRFNKPATERALAGTSIFDVSDVPASSTATSRIAVFALQAGTYPVSATVKAGEDLVATTSAVYIVAK